MVLYEHQLLCLHIVGNTALIIYSSREESGPCSSIGFPRDQSIHNPGFMSELKD